MKRPIAIFDSGLGGLTVAAELLRQLPDEWFVYFGDTARVPYGCKSAQTVTRFAMQAVEFLLQFDPKIIVAACNTASSMALATLQQAVNVPVVGVIEPGAEAAVQAVGDRCLAVIGTEATIGSRAYHRAIWQLNAEARIVSKACPLLVSIAEEGRGPDDPVTELAVQQYLLPLKEHDPGVLLLGCTHYPLLREAFARTMGPEVALIDSAYHTAKRVAELAAETAAPTASVSNDGPVAGTVRCFVSDNPERFAALGTRFLQQPLGQVSLVPLDLLISDPGGALGVMAVAGQQFAPEESSDFHVPGNATSEGDIV